MSIARMLKNRADLSIISIMIDRPKLFARKDNDLHQYFQASPRFIAFLI